MSLCKFFCLVINKHRVDVSASPSTHMKMTKESLTLMSSNGWHFHCQYTQNFYSTYDYFTGLQNFPSLRKYPIINRGAVTCFSFILLNQLAYSKVTVKQWFDIQSNFTKKAGFVEILYCILFFSHVRECNLTFFDWKLYWAILNNFFHLQEDYWRRDWYSWILNSNFFVENWLEYTRCSHYYVECG